MKSLPGVILILAAAVLFALVTFNVPLMKSLYFLQGTFTSGKYDGSIKLGTLGYCLTTGGDTTCVGPQVGYSFDLNTILGVSSKTFNIPTAVSKYLTYVLILHAVALGFAVIALIVGLLDLIPGFAMMCFPTCLASITGGIALIAFIIDLAMFFIAKKAIDNVSGASASIGPAVWMTLAGWLCAAFAGCAYGMGQCCCCGTRGDDRRRRRNKDKTELDEYRRDEDMRLHAIRDEQRRQKEADLPSFEPYERVPLTTDREDKYLYDEGQDNVSGLRRDGSVLNGVGVGYGRRNPYAGGAAAGVAGAAAYAGATGVHRQPSVQSSVFGPGQAGVGSGGAGVDQRYDPYAEYDQGHQEQFADNNYASGNYYDPYGQQSSEDPYNQYNQPTYPPAAAVSPPHQTGPHDYHAQPDYFSGPTSTESGGYHDPGPHVQHADPYHGYGDDDGLGAIGLAATSPTGERQYTGAQGFAAAGPLAASPIQVPTPQHLVQHGQHNILTSPVNEYSSPTDARSPASYYGDDAHRPPSYGTVAGATTYPQEKRR